MKKMQWQKSKGFIIVLLVVILYGGYLGLQSLNSDNSAVSGTSGLTLDPNTTYIDAVVTEVVDGDTIQVLINNQKATIRLILVDTPETKHPSKPVEPFGPEASLITKKLLEGKTIKLEDDVSKADRYGRMLKYVWVDDRMVNEMLLEQGLARVAVFPPDVKYVDEFRAVQKKAQKAQIGIWSLENYAENDEAEHEPSSDVSAIKQIYESCAAVRAAGKAPIKSEDTGYSKKLDGDGDGIGCE